MVADYRAYGSSTGLPSVSAMIHDSHVIFSHTKQLMKEKGYTGKFIIMAAPSAALLRLSSLKAIMMR